MTGLARALRRVLRWRVVNATNDNRIPVFTIGGRPVPEFDARAWAFEQSCDCEPWIAGEPAGSCGEPVQQEAGPRQLVLTSSHASEVARD